MSRPKLERAFLERAAEYRDIGAERARARAALRRLFDVAGEPAALAAAIRALDGPILWPVHEQLGRGAFDWVRLALEAEIAARPAPPPIPRDPADSRENPYVDDFLAFAPSADIEATIAAMNRLRATYAYTIPTAGALELLANLGPLIEVGAGTGYWAWLLRKKNVDVLAFDPAPPDGTFKNQWFVGARTWTQVDVGATEQVEGHADRALLLCWPPSNSEVALDAVRRYRGEHVVFGGEWSTHLASPPFYDVLDREFVEVGRVALPSWLDDEILVASRRRRARRSRKQG